MSRDLAKETGRWQRSRVVLQYFAGGLSAAQALERAEMAMHGYMATTEIVEASLTTVVFILTTPAQRSVAVAGVQVRDLPAGSPASQDRLAIRGASSKKKEPEP